ncbi:uncharacterized protein F5147DRAFT_784185 [Suillus discolor]|uniref:DUF6830 domain-containing protein n=1 Tax=Suillus discolor TaxID=1912936 RepID=A0A9P7EPY5_9AGAM|nr:uncharacterized protein F5147DRAFT_784185 [Suillus discolor]KAG2080574.1 hypothetical protein F5147DRAFT_784185 [Suillus discolor]
MDRAEECCRFELATSLLDRKQCAEEPEDVDPDVDDDVDTYGISPKPQQPRHMCPIMNYFAIARALWCRDENSVPVPLRSFSVRCTAFDLGYDPSIRSITVDGVTCEDTHGHQHIHAIGGPRRAGPTADLPFNKIQVWFKICLQETDFHNTHTIKPA